MRVLLFFFAALTAAVAVHAQTPPPAAQPQPAPVLQTPATPAAQPPAAATGQTVCGQPVPVPRAIPPDGSGPVVYQVVPCFEKQGGFPVVEANTYLYYIQLRPSVERPLGVLRRVDRADDPRGLQASVGDELPR